MSVSLDGECWAGCLSVPRCRPGGLGYLSVLCHGSEEGMLPVLPEGGVLVCGHPQRKTPPAATDYHTARMIHNRLRMEGKQRMNS